MKLRTLLIPAVVLVVPFAVLADDGAVQITFDPADDIHPSWSPCFSHGSNHAATPPPQDSNIAFESFRPASYYSSIWTIPASGGEASLWPPRAGRGWHRDPAWSPDGSQIAFQRVPDDCTSPSRLWVRPGPGPIALGGSGPAWSPDGSQIAFGWDNYGDNYDIWIVPAAGGTVTQVTLDPASDWGPCWSPDGTRIAFVSARSGSQEIWVIPAAGGTATRITAGGGGSPAWSPDGEQIAFGAAGDIWTIPATGGVATQITTDPASDGCPTWHPGGDLLAFESDRSGNMDIWVIPITGTVALDQESWGSIKAKHRD